MRFSNHSLKIHTTAESSALIVGTLRSLSHQLNSQITTPETGNVYDVMHVITEQRPQISFASYAIKTLLGAIPLIGKAVDSDGTHPGVVAYAQSHDASQSTARGGTGTHLSLTCGLGHLVLNRIAGDRNGLVELACTLHGMTPDGDTEPFVAAYDDDLPSAPVINEEYGIGKAQVLGSTVEQIVSTNVDLNPQLELVKDADSIWPALVDVQKIAALTTIITEDPAWLDPGTRIPFNGKQTTSSDTFLNYLRYEVSSTAAASGGAFQDFAGTNHIKQTVTGLVHITDHYSGSGDGISQTQIQIASLSLSGVAPIVNALTSAYTL